MRTQYGPLSVLGRQVGVLDLISHISREQELSEMISKALLLKVRSVGRPDVSTLSGGLLEKQNPGSHLRPL
jgi:hypothetical protein